MYDICIFRHSKSVMSMTFMCLGIAKLECQISLGISFSSLISSCMIYLKKKHAKKNQKQKDKKMLLNMIACWCMFFFHLPFHVLFLFSLYTHASYLFVCNLAMFFTHNTQYSLLFLIHVQIQCDLVIISFTCVNVCLLNCLDLFLKYKIG